MDFEGVDCINNLANHAKARATMKFLLLPVNLLGISI